jgi:hypothetical protein
MLAESNSLPDLGPGYMNPKWPLSNAYRNYGLALAIPKYRHFGTKKKKSPRTSLLCLSLEQTVLILVQL